MADILLITPPFTQLNTPYPATAYIKGFLKTKDINAFQMDLGIEVILKLFSANGLKKIFAQAIPESENARRIYALRAEYIKKVEPVVHFLQGQRPSLARQIASHNHLPQAGRFAQLDDMEWAFGNMGIQDKAKHLGTMFLEDLSDFIKECVDENFGFSRYAERLGMSANSFDEIYDTLQEPLSFVDGFTIEILEERLKEVKPKLVCLSVPFPGNLYSAFRCGQWIKNNNPEIKIAMGGGFANTELRELADPRVFEFFDYISLDDGELPLELIISNVLNPSESNPNYNFLKRTFIIDGEEIIYNNFSLRKDYAQAELGTPDYSDLLLDQYISVIEIANPMHSLWSDGRWNKLTMAHGCYWGNCTFCDVSLDYIKNYEPVAGKLLVDRMEEIIAQTGETGFHFVDEAAPPALMRELAMEIIERGLIVSWWTNIRFEKNFTYDLCRLLKASGCIAVSGGLEVASDRLLKLIDKGVTVEQVAKVNRNFTEAGIMVHSYLMYGYPTQTVQETIDSLEMVRQMFELGILQSGFWHQFALTTHSPVGMKPEAYGVIPELKPIEFANNDVQFKDSTGIDHSKFSFGLKKSLFNFMHGVGFDFELKEWFDFKVPPTSIGETYILDCLEDVLYPVTKKSALIMWLGSPPILISKGKKVELKLYRNEDEDSVMCSKENGEWLMKFANSNTPQRYIDLKKDYELKYKNFDTWWYSSEMDVVKEMNLLIL
ncbi:B12-binding domain-containing radical SAM protein [Portibacter lacus]|uniref:Radical SAM protein n=1 Tax=Portibacter lacus TaxID=1099794 RepID=A0AA37SNX9_9BACT|nr:radical SAM protein [Portibacter lacus]GLR16038.1 radical SAM protein [Portibacter lacus]